MKVIKNIIFSLIPVFVLLVLVELLARFIGVPNSMPILPALRFKQTAMQIDNICKQNNIRYFVVLQPFKDCGKSVIEKLPQDGSLDNRNQFIYRALLTNWKASPEVTMPYLETSALIGDDLDNQKLFADDCHLWDNGFILLNKATVTWLKTNL
jgi:hypothetical protein